MHDEPIETKGCQSARALAMKPPESARNDLAAERFSGLYDGLVASQMG
jgi:hypothetical protein